MTEQIRVILADDHPIVRQGLRQVIERENDLVVLAEFDDGAPALDSICALRPDVALLDIDMPQMGGFDVLAALREQKITIPVIVLTVHSEEAFFNKALELGARGYLLKDTAIADIVKGIRAVAAGQNYVSPLLSSYLLKQKRSQPKTDPTGTGSLTKTEKQILRLIAEYKTNYQIADDLCVSPLTVKTHRRNISIKLDLEGKHALMKFALENKDEL